MRGQLLAALFIVSSGIISVSQKMEYRPTCGCRKQTICRTRLAFLGHFRLLKQRVDQVSPSSQQGHWKESSEMTITVKRRGETEDPLDQWRVFLMSRNSSNGPSPRSQDNRCGLKQLRRLRYTFTLPPKKFTPIHTGGIKPFAPICLQLYTYLFVRLL